VADIDAVLQNCPTAAEEFYRNPQRDFLRFTGMGEFLRGHKLFHESAVFFLAAFELRNKSEDALLALLTTQLYAGQTISDDLVTQLSQLNPAFGRYFQALCLAAQKQSDPVSVLRCIGNSFEAFVSGAEVDWLFLRQMQAWRSNGGLADQIAPSVSPIPKRIFIYWDKQPPPEISANIDYHKGLEGFETEFFDKERASAFLFEHYGADTRNLFLMARHPAEGSDFLRYHLIYSLGGYYIDSDEQFISGERVTELAGTHDGLFTLAPTGPVENAVFGACAGSTVMEECLRILAYNQLFQPNLSIWLKTGPGVLTRALTRQSYRALQLGQTLSNFVLYGPEVYGSFVRSIIVSYRDDARDWRVFEAQQQQST
jgi:hypothetical protein